MSDAEQPAGAAGGVRFTEREERVLKAVWGCMKTPPEVDMEKLQVAAGFNTLKTTSNCWGGIKKKLAQMNGSGFTAPAAKATATRTPKKTPTKRVKEEVADEDGMSDDESPTKKARIVVGVEIEKAEDAVAFETTKRAKSDEDFVVPDWANTTPGNDPPPFNGFTAINKHDELDDDVDAMEDLQLLTPKAKTGTTTRKRTPARKQKDEDGDLDMAEPPTRTPAKKGRKRVTKKPAMEDDDEDAAVVGAV